MSSKHNEIERRWLVGKEVDAIVRSQPPVELEQGYLTAPGQLRVRITTMQEPGRYAVHSAELTKKTGKGIERVEENADISYEAARMLLATTPYHIRKTRYTVDGWEVDFFHDRLEGLVIVERELKSRDEAVTLPPWFSDPVEVTDVLSNRQLAVTTHILDGGELGDVSQRKTWDVPRIVMTGGPCGGKSSILRELAASGRFHCVPEVATILMGQVGIMPGVGEATFQRTLYSVQRSLEEAASKQALLDGKEAVILDRGTLDSAAFTQGGLPAYLDLVGTDLTGEYDNYDAVVLFGVLDRQLYDAHRASNLVRSESWEQARAVEGRLGDVWAQHPKLHRVAASLPLDEKVRVMHGIVENTVRRC